MIYHRERIVHGHVSSEQIVQLFDDMDSMVTAVADFLDEGRREGANLLVVARATHWDGTSVRLEAAGCPVAEMLAREQLIVLDAMMILATFCRSGEPDPMQFDAHVGNLVRELAARGRLRVYAEMIDVLAEHGAYTAAEEVESFWHQLAHQCSFQVLSGYVSSRFTDRSRDPALEAILGARPRVQSESTDLLAVWLLAERQSRYHTD